MLRKTMILCALVSSIALPTAHAKRVPISSAPEGRTSHSYPILAYAEHASLVNGGFKAIIFDDLKGFAFRTVAPNRIETWKLQLSPTEMNRLAALFSNNRFTSVPSKLSADSSDYVQTSLFYANANVYHEVKDRDVSHRSVQTIKEGFDRFLKQKIASSQRVPITELLWASKTYERCHAAGCPKTRCVRNVTSDLCRILSSKQELDYDIAKDFFIRDRYLQDVDH